MYGEEKEGGLCDNKGIRRKKTAKLNGAKNREYLPIIEKDISGKVKQADILYLAQDLRNVVIVRREGSSVIVRGHVGDFKDKLDENFHMCHSYLIINLERIVSMTAETIEFDNGEEKHIGRNNFYKVRKVYNNYLINL